jgi:hypothetical protein
MTQRKPREDTCRHCGLDIIEGICIDALGEARPGTWTHIAGGLICATGSSGGVAAPASEAPAEVDA